MQEYTISGHEQLEQEVKEFGNGAHITLPNDWTNGTVTAILTQKPNQNQTENNLYQLHITFANLRNITLSDDEKQALKNLTEQYDINTLNDIQTELKNQMNNPEEYTLNQPNNQEQKHNLETLATKLLNKFNDLHTTET